MLPVILGVRDRVVAGQIPRVRVRKEQQPVAFCVCGVCVVCVCVCGVWAGTLINGWKFQSMGGDVN